MFEDYLPTYSNENALKSCQTILNQRGLKWCLEWALHNDNVHQNDNKKKYSYYLSCITEIYYALDKMSDKNEIVNQNMGIVIKIINVIKELDTGCGIEEGISSQQSREQQEEILVRLDDDREIFKQILIRNMQDNDIPDYALLFILSFAELIFLFNGYQAPPRSNPVDAFNDSLGLTDLFDELMNEIFNELRVDENPQDENTDEDTDEDTEEDDESYDSDSYEESEIDEITIEVEVESISNSDSSEEEIVSSNETKNESKNETRS
jgi:hypothetical protein